MLIIKIYYNDNTFLKKSLEEIAKMRGFSAGNIHVFEIPSRDHNDVFIETVKQ